jgi:hypothetical protein
MKKNILKQPIHFKGQRKTHLSRGGLCLFKNGVAMAPLAGTICHAVHFITSFFKRQYAAEKFFTPILSHIFFCAAVK